MTQDVDKYEEYKAYLEEINSALTIDDQEQCLGFCQVPKHILFTPDKMPVDGQQSCSIYIIGYLVKFVSMFSNYCMWHAKICIFQFLLCMFMYFKMPSLSKQQELEKIYKEKQRALRVYKFGLAQNDEKLNEIEEARIDEEQYEIKKIKEHLERERRIHSLKDRNFNNVDVFDHDDNSDADPNDTHNRKNRRNERKKDQREMENSAYQLRKSQ